MDPSSKLHVLVALVLAPAATLGCSGRVSTSGPADGGSSSGGGDGGTVVLHGPSDKVDLLFMIDNTKDMDQVQALLALAVPRLVGRLATPNCLDSGTKQPTGMISDPDGNCPSGSKAEFLPVHDMHIGIVSASLGSRGGDVCPDNAMNPANPALSAHTNDNGELINRGGVLGMPTMETDPGTPDAPSPLNFLSYFPTVSANSGHPAPLTPPIPTSGTLVSDFTALVAGVGAHGCGFQAQNEAWYRFLVQPDPFQTLTKNGNSAAPTGIDATILQQRAAFLRPDSLLAIIMVTASDEKVGDPFAISGQGWAFEQTSFPGSQSGGGAPQGTIECSELDPNNPSTTGPNDPNCVCCVFDNLGSNAQRCPKNGTSGNDGYLDPANDAIHLRFFHQKERFGLFAGYPVTRYVRGLQRTTVPSVGLAFQGDTDHEHDAMGNYVGDQDSQADCVNPIYAQNLPTSASSDLCHLTRGPRTPDLVYYAAIAGVPHQLLQAAPGDPECPSGTPAAQCPQKDRLSANDWTLIAGRDPEHYDFRGADFHMVESETARTNNTGGWANRATSTNQAGCQMGLDATGTDAVAPAGCDPINGAEFNTKNEDLQFACIYPLIQVSGGSVALFQKDCTQMEYSQECDCAASSLDVGSQLCSPTTATMQVNAKAYPSVREMVIANAMSTQVLNGQVFDQGVVSSVCPIRFDVGQPVATAQADPLFGYNPAVDAIVGRIKKSIKTM
jgi:hypothetical protein